MRRLRAEAALLPPGAFVRVTGVASLVQTLLAARHQQPGLVLGLVADVLRGVLRPVGGVLDVRRALIGAALSAQAPVPGDAAGGHLRPALRVLGRVLDLRADTHRESFPSPNPSPIPAASSTAVPSTSGRTT